MASGCWSRMAWVVGVCGVAMLGRCSGDSTTLEQKDCGAGLACLDVSQEVVDDLGPTETVQPDADVMDARADVDADVVIPAPLPAQAGFIDIEPVTYTIRNAGREKVFTSSEARIWYIFQPADQNPEEKPLAVFFNGGPGSSTSLLFGFNTGRLTVDPRLTGGEPRMDNPASWTRFANLLYVDARQTGFSYNLMDNVQNRSLRNKEFETRNFNPLFDGADFVRVVLRFLAAHPVLQDNPVVIVGESYGGIRGTVMGYLLLNYSEMQEGTILYEDVELAKEIQAHFDAIWPELAGTRVPREKIVEQFGHIAFVQPLLTGIYQTEVSGQMFEMEDSLVHKVAAEVGVEYESCGDLPPEMSCDPEYHAQMFMAEVAKRDLYNVVEPSGWIDEISLIIDDQLEQPQSLASLIECDPMQIDGLFSANRKRAYRWGDEPGTTEALAGNTFLPKVQQTPLLPYPLQKKVKEAAQKPVHLFDVVLDELEKVFGQLYDWDEHYISSQYLITTTFYMFDSLIMKMDPSASIYGELFLYDAAFMKIFITRAANDIVIYAPAIPGALAMHDDLVQSVEHVTQGDGPRPGLIRVTYKEGAFPGVTLPKSVDIRFPDYWNSGHPVEATEPEEFLVDVQSWYLSGGEE